MDKIVINVTGQTDLDSTIKKLVELGLVDEKNAKAFLKNSKSTQDEIDKTKSSYSGLKDSVTQYLQALPGAQHVQQITNLTKGMNATSAATAGASKAMNFLKIAIASTGISALVIAVAALYASFQRTEKGGDQLAKIMRVIGIVVDGLIKGLSFLGEIIIDVVSQWVNGFNQIYEFITGTFFKAIEAVADVLASMGFEKAAESVKKFNAELKQGKSDAEAYLLALVKAGQELADMEDALEEKTIAIKLANDALTTTIEKNLKALRNRTNSYQENLKIIEEISKAEKERFNNSTSLIEDEIAIEKKKFVQQAKDQTKAALLFDQFVNKQIGALDIIAELDGTNTSKTIDNIAEVMHKQEDANRQSLVLEERLQNFKDAAVEKEKARIDKAFQDKLKEVDDIEKLAVAKAKIEDKNAGEILKIEEVFNNKRITLFKQFGKTKETDYKALLLNQEALEKGYTDFLVEEENRRNEEVLKALDTAFKIENTAYKQNYAQQLRDLAERYKTGQINRIQFEKESSSIAFNFQKDATEREIELIQQKIGKTKEGSVERIQLEADLADAQTKLYQQDLDAFKKGEDEKTKKQKEENDKRKQLNQLFTDFAIQSIQKVAAVQLENNRIKTDNEINVLQVQTDSQIEALQKRNDAGILSDEAFAAQKEALQKKQQQKELELKRRQAMQEKNFALFQIAINTASAVLKAFSTFGPPPSPLGIAAAAAAVLTGGIEAAIVSSKPLPGFKKGGYTGDGNVNSEAGIVHKKEFVMPAEKTAKYREDLQAMYEGRYSKDYRNPIKLERSLTDIRGDNMADSIYKSMLINGFNDKNIVNAIGKNNKVKLANGSELANQIATKISDRTGERGLYA